MDLVYSIIVPAYNEEHWLPDCLDSIKQAMAEQSCAGEFIVCDNNSSDNTAMIARLAGARVVFEPHNQISRARNSGAGTAQGQYLIFVDADTRISAELLQAALHGMQSGQCVGGGAIVSLDGQMSVAERFGLWCWNQLSIHLRLAAGCFVFCRRDDFEQLGGFSEAVYASEELWFSQRLRRHGKARKQPFCILTEYSPLSSGRKGQWYSPMRQLLLLVSLLLFPFLVRYRRFCGFWYQRPGDKPGQK